MSIQTYSKIFLVFKVLSDINRSKHYSENMVDSCSFYPNCYKAERKKMNTILDY